MRFDVAVIGGGPAGMMAAGRAAELGVCVALLEKNKGLGRKLLLTGNGRCNLTNHQPDPKKFISAFGKEGRFLLPSLMSFGVEDTLDFFHSRGLETKIEDGNRVFPKTDRAKDVLAVLDEFLREHNVTILDHTRVESMSVQGNRAEMYVGGRRFEADKIIIATGGKSYPSTGSTGDGMRWAEALGHSIAPTRPALAPIVLEEQWAMEGVSFQNIGVSAFSKGKKVMGGRGDVLFTSEGLSGPIILDMSSAIGKVMEEADVELRIDFMPDTEHPDLDHML
ncbi:MAG: aminoacetone oxidase family FAD-binding enzyme, partial [Candidatus Thermoplasmatota archaeon]|nr:aminoacetone oxidase family FAD-binding enzyme [Candidatus Thermoplasmatota archaeon]